MYSVFDYLESVIEAFNKPQAIKRGMQQTNRDFWFVAFATQQWMAKTTATHDRNCTIQNLIPQNLLK